MLSGVDLAVQYPNGAIGIDGVTVEVVPGKISALFGPNGAGKTTTIRALTGFLRTERTRVIRGQVSVSGRPLTNAEPSDFSRAGIALVPERRKVFADMTVGENLRALRLPSGHARQPAYEKVIGLFPRLASKLSVMAGSLSGGEQQMVAIGRALMRSPDYLLVDEMTLGLHVSLMEPLFGAMRQIAQEGSGILLVDESIALTLEVCDYCYLIRGGVLVDQGPPDKYRGNELLAAGYVGDP
jgi:branched-chain amino acid transport system ATP-binding protein